MNTHKFLTIVLLCSFFLFAFQQKSENSSISLPSKKNYDKQLAESLNLTDKQVYGLKAMKSIYAVQKRKINLFRIEDATIIRKLNSIYERKVRFFLGDGLYKSRMEHKKKIEHQKNK